MTHHRLFVGDLWGRSKKQRDPALVRKRGPRALGLSKFSGAKAEDIAARLKVSVYIPAADQASGQWLGGGEGSKLAEVLKDTAGFLKEQKKINQVLDSYAAFVDPRFVQATLASN